MSGKKEKNNFDRQGTDAYTARLKQEEEDPNELRDLRAEKRSLQRSVAWLKFENQERLRERLEAKEAKEAKEALAKAKQQHQ